jgi:hypothetical protein
MALSDHELIYHYRFDGGLQDSGPNGFHMSTTQTEGTHYEYVDNKDGIASRAIRRMGLHVLVADVDYVGIRGSLSSTSSFLVSVWVKRTGNLSDTSSIVLTSGRRIGLGERLIGSKSNNITSYGRSSGMALDIDSWTNICFLYNYISGTSFELASFMNGIRRYYSSSVSLTFTNSVSQESSIGQNIEVDEIRFYKLNSPIVHGTAANGQPGANEIAELYNLGVNNIPAPNITGITDITHNSAKINWEVNSV